jgi:hypothetical protein
MGNAEGLVNLSYVEAMEIADYLYRTYGTTVIIPCKGTTEYTE